MKWPEWLVLGIAFVILAVFCFAALDIGTIFGVGEGLQQYLVFGSFFGFIFLVIAIASFINLLITATREHIKKKTKA